MEVLATAEDARAFADAARAGGERVALVPTMGALHAGHVRLIEVASERAERVVVSIFVNQLQFDRPDDFARYPRTWDDDLAACTSAGAHAVYAPTSSALYPAGFDTFVDVGALTHRLEGEHRPGHFRGVTTVVTKLFNACRPDVAVFGEKDFQQLAIVRRMAADLDIGVEIVGVPTVREHDGVALSSRNRLLSPAARRAAACIPRALDAAEERARSSADAVAILGAGIEVIAAEEAATLEYLALADEATLEPLERLDRPGRLLAAVWIDGVRLIDNRGVAPLG